MCGSAMQKESILGLSESSNQGNLTAEKVSLLEQLSRNIQEAEELPTLSLI